ncbi:membrane protein [Deltaproteobacteria bacterium]|nr:membrane protein [Deltaproteobacteria bacterium]
MPPLPTASATAIRRVRRLLEPLMRYHQFTVEGVENVPREGPCLLVVHHSFATYDGFLIGGAIFEHLGRLPVGLGDDRIFQLGRIGEWARAIGLVPASPDAGEQALRAGQLLAVAPGGMWEALRPRTERRTTRWGERRGFARLALRTGAPIVVAACPAADDIFTIYPSPITNEVYRLSHWPIPFLRGRGPTLIPRPIKLTGYFAPAIVPPPYDAAHEDEQVDALVAEAKARMAELLRRA